MKQYHLSIINFHIIFLTSVVIIISFFIILNSQQNSQKIVEPKPYPSETGLTETNSDMLNWETYRNDNFGFFIQYPESYKIYKYIDKNNSRLILKIAKNCVQIEAYTPPALKEIQNPDAAILDYQKLANLTIGESKTYTYPESQLNNDAFTLEITYKRLDDKVIGDTEWFQLEIKNNYENHGTLPNYFINKNNYYWSIQSTSDAGCSVETIDQILSTFRFTE